MTQRTILFRGKRIDNVEWVEGSLGYNSRYRTYHITVHNRPTIPSDMSVEVDPATVGQFTGLTDKNGVKIFEGDIVKCPTATEPEENGFIVVYKSYRLFFSNVNYPDLNTYGSDNWEYFSKYSEVIGNIHTK